MLGSEAVRSWKSRKRMGQSRCSTRNSHHRSACRPKFGMGARLREKAEADVPRPTPRQKINARRKADAPRQKINARRKADAPRQKTDTDVGGDGGSRVQSRKCSKWGCIDGAKAGLRQVRSRDGSWFKAEQEPGAARGVKMTRMHETKGEDSSAIAQEIPDGEHEVMGVTAEVPVRRQPIWRLVDLSIRGNDNLDPVVQPSFYEGTLNILKGWEG